MEPGSQAEETDSVLMPLRRPGVLSSLPDWLCGLVAGLLILGAAVLHLVYLTHNCPLDLAPDEAHYWDWSRNLDWSYYSKGPLVACLIRGSCDLVGAWSEKHTGNLMFAVRLPAVVCGSLLLLGLYLLTVQVYGRHRLALAVVCGALTFPLIAVGSSLMTIDAPYTCCWCWALVLGHRALFRNSPWAWPALGLVVGLGILAKYTMALWVPCAGLFLLTSPEHRSLLHHRGFWIMVGAAGLCCLPILIWNAQHGWVSFRHVFGLAGLVAGPAASGPKEPRIDWLGPLVYLGGQCALLLIFWFVAWLAAMIAHSPWWERDAGTRYLWWMSTPMFLVFLTFSFKTGGGELNWPVTAYLAGFILAANWLGRQLKSPIVWYRRLTAGNMALACGVGLFITVFMHRSDWLQPVFSWLSGPPTESNPYPLRRFDPTCRLRGWRMLASQIDRLRADLAREGIDPVLAGCSWNVPGELGLYCSGHPRVYSIGLAAGDRHSQYDLWLNPVADPRAFHNRTFLVVGGITPTIRAAFEQVGQTVQITYREHGQPITSWMVTICRGFRGFPVQMGSGDRF
jgi:hypothetical protein